MNDRRSASSALVAVVLILSTTAAACGNQAGSPRQLRTPTNAEVVAPEVTDSEVQGDEAVQQTMDRLVSDIHQGRDGEDTPGFAGLAVDLESRTIEVYWVGVPAPHVRRVATTSPTGIEVKVHPATYDLSEMLRAIDRITLEYGSHIHTASPSDDGTGIFVQKTAANVGSHPDSVALSRLAEMPVTVDIGEQPEAAHD